MLIGIHGRAGVGKDTVADMLWEEKGFVKLAFADPLKRATQIIFGLSDAQTWGRFAKEQIIPEWGLSPRQMFQQLGSAVRDLTEEGHWIKRLEQDYALLDASHVAISDVRYENEAAWVRAKGGVVLHLARDGVEPVAAHHSEDGIKARPEDYLIINDGSLEELRQRVLKFLEYANGR
jgi:hypothetical protein